ncbi:MAG: hypothetical protein ACM3UY_11365 [Methanocella sp.]|jgi:sulfur relay (sulfurtransferase) DsrC/TusE family protein
MSKAPDLSKFNKLKEYKGKKYTGVKVGHGHTWQYEAGEWKETKTDPNKWKFSYKVGKKRRGKAPEGSGAPVGTEYHWYIVADQIVKKLDANNYSTEMTGTKYKVAHKRANKENWSINNAKQKKEIIKILKDMIAELETQPEPEMTTETGRKQKKSKQTQLVFASP